jgi:hypothetical protein
MPEEVSTLYKFMAALHYMYFACVDAVACRKIVGGSVYDCIPPQEKVLYLST